MSDATTPTGTPTSTTTATATGNLPVLAMQIAPKDLVDSAKFTPAQREKVEQIAQAVNLEDSTTVMLFGSAPQKKLNQYLDVLLSDMRTEEAGIAGDLAIEMAEGIDMMQIQSLKKEMGPGWSWSKLPLIGRFFAHARYFWERKQKFLDQIDKIVRKAEDRKRKLIEFNAKLDGLMKETEIHISEIEMWIAGGEKALMMAREEFDRRKAEGSGGDPLKAAKLHDFANQINAFETRLMRMKVAYTDAIISIPQIRLTQESGKIEIQNIMDSLLFDLPRLKHAVIRVAALLNIRKARQEDELRREAAAKIAQVGADLLHEAYIEAKASQGRALDDVQALAELANKLMATIHAGQEIDKQNLEKRKAAADQLVAVKGKVVDALEQVERGATASPPPGVNPNIGADL